jgi:hypothetical protein
MGVEKLPMRLSTSDGPNYRLGCSNGCVPGQK